MDDGAWSPNTLVRCVIPMFIVWVLICLTMLQEQLQVAMTGASARSRKERSDKETKAKAKPHDISRFSL